MTAFPLPDLGLPFTCGESDTQRYVIDAHFDDDAAPECDSTVRAGNEPTELPRIAEYWCRTTLVVERMTSAGRR